LTLPAALIRFRNKVWMSEHRGGRVAESPTQFGTVFLGEGNTSIQDSFSVRYQAAVRATRGDATWVRLASNHMRVVGERPIGGGSQQPRVGLG